MIISDWMTGITKAEELCIDLVAKDNNLLPIELYARGRVLLLQNSGDPTANIFEVVVRSRNKTWWMAVNQQCEEAILKSLHEGIDQPFIHDLESQEKYFKQILSGLMQFDVRKCDRDYRVGDRLHLKEIENDSTGKFTGRSLDCDITCILSSNELTTNADFVVLGIEKQLYTKHGFL